MVDQSEDRIEREIAIGAPAQQVWDVISQPGWWINDGAITEHRIERAGDLDVVHDPVHGAFRIRTVRLDPPHYAAFQWIMAEASSTDASASGASTLTEFWIDDRDDGVLLRVVESGFSTLDLPAAERRTRLEENTSGWELELDVARVHAEKA